MVASQEVPCRTQCGSPSLTLSKIDQIKHPDIDTKDHMNNIYRLEFELSQLEQDLIVNPNVENHFSKSLLANREIPQDIRQQCQNSRDFNLSKMQNGHQFGFIPLTDVKTYQGPPVTWHNNIDILEAHSIIRNSGVPNFLKCRIPVQTQLKPKVWKTN